MNRVTFNINTGKADNYLDYRPEIKEVKLKKDGTPYANSVSVEDQIAEFEGDCALNALTGRIINIAIKLDNRSVLLSHYDGTNPNCTSESEMIGEFWRYYEELKASHYFVSFNGTDFDIPFLIQRSWILKVPVPLNWRDRDMMMHADLMQIWHKSYSRAKDKKFAVSLDTMSKAILGVGKKYKGISERYEWFWEHEHEKAVEYAIDEDELTYKCSLIMMGE